jgi:YgiT-type zinc finger domain-containing protein
MKCPISRNGETAPDEATVTLERDGRTLVIRKVPARVCGNCGEEYVDEDTTRRLLEPAEKDVREGVAVDVRDYVAA